MKRCIFQFLMVSIPLLAAIGCGASPAPSVAAKNEAASNPAPVDEVAEVRSTLSPEDRELVEAQEWCVVMPSERLGAMGAPIKLDIEGQPVFVCCAGCKKKAAANPEQTLAKLADLKAKAKEEKAVMK